MRNWWEGGSRQPGFDNRRYQFSLRRSARANVVPSINVVLVEHSSNTELFGRVSMTPLQRPSTNRPAGAPPALATVCRNPMEIIAMKIRRHIAEVLQGVGSVGIIVKLQDSNIVLSVART